MNRRPLRRWPARMTEAARFAVGRRDTWGPALAAFLLRGGLVLLVLPIVVIPSPVAFAAIFGVDAFTIAGQPSAWLLTVALVVATLATVWLLSATWLGALADVWLVGEYVRRRTPTPEPDRPRVPAGSAIPLFAIRLVLMVPVAAVLTWALVWIGGATYTELQVPSNLATPLAIRVAERTAPAVVAAMGTWLVAETIGAIAVRRVCLGEQAVYALADAVEEIVTRPVSTLATVLVAYVPSIAAIGASLAVAADAFDFVRVAARADPSLALEPLLPQLAAKPLFLLGGAIAVAAAVLLALAVAAVTAAWRSAVFSAEVRHAIDWDRAAASSPNGSPKPAAEHLGLSRGASERSGD